MQKKYLTFTKENGEEVKAEILFTYHSEEFKKDYVVFLPGDTNEVAAASYTEDGNGGSLDAIETDEEWDLIEDLLEDYVNTNESSGYECCSDECNCDEGCCGDCDSQSCGCKEN